MGLNAIVYRNISNLTLDTKDEHPLVDKQTGEVYFDNPKLAQEYGENVFTAAQKRLGNAASIGSIKAEIPLEIIDKLSLLYDKVLYSASHSGDFISVERLEDLESEINLLKEKTASSKSPSLESFIEDMIELIKAAKEQRNPIVFV